MHSEEIMTDEGIQLNVEGKIDVLTANDFQAAVLKAFVKSQNVIP